MYRRMGKNTSVHGAMSRAIEVCEVNAAALPAAWLLAHDKVAEC